MAGTMSSPQATYYAETCYLKSLTYPLIAASCSKELPARRDEFDAALRAWQDRYAAHIERSRAHLESTGYDFQGPTIRMAQNVARSWVSSEVANGPAAVAETCDAHLSDLKS
jgi:hypothetical protein